MPTRDIIYISKLLGTSVYDSLNDYLGFVYDTVFVGPKNLHLTGLILQTPQKKHVFVPITRMIEVSSTKIIITGNISMRKYQKTHGESLAVTDILETKITVIKRRDENSYIRDIGVRKQRGEWVVRKLFVRFDKKIGGGFLRIGEKFETVIVDINDIEFHSDTTEQASELIRDWYEMKPADIANELRVMPYKKQISIVQTFDDELLADVLEEMVEKDQLKIIAGFDDERAAEIISSMSPDDVADLLHELPNKKTAQLLELMDDEVSDNIRQLLIYPEDSAGGLMTTDVVLMPPDATVSEALANIMQEELNPIQASAIFVVRPPLDTPSGTFIGLAHFQRLLRTPAHAQIGELVDTDIEYVEPYDSFENVTQIAAMYNQLIVPVLNKNRNLLGAITVDDVLDRVLPDNWRKNALGFSGRKEENDQQF